MTRLRQHVAEPTFIPFQHLPVGSYFSSPEGILCQKTSPTAAVIRDDGMLVPVHHSMIGETVPFGNGEHIKPETTQEH